MGQENEAQVVWKQGMTFEGRGKSGFTVTMDDGPDGFSPMELVLVALAGCSSMDIISILQKKRQEVNGFEIRVHGLRRDEYPRVFTDITLEYVVRGKDIRPDAVQSAIDLSNDKYCSVMGMLKESVNIQTRAVIEETGNSD